mgnify:FL=1
MFTKLLFTAGLCIPAVAGLHGTDVAPVGDWPKPGECVSPATCTAPTAQFKRVMNVQSRQQWGDSGGYCGSLSVQAIAMNYGAWISQTQVRKAAGPGGGHGDRKNGYEILHTNIEGALDKLKLTYSAWDYTQPVPQTEPYLTWLKKQLSSGYPVVWMIYCKGDMHNTYFLANYDHVEPVWGIYSNHSLDDTTVYPDDVLVHGADYGAEGSIAGPSLYRRFEELADTKKMDGNCSNAISGPGHNEYYPCVPSDGRDWGFAITGYVGGSDKDVPVSLAVDRFDEPDIVEGAKAAEIHGTVTVTGLTAQSSYRLYRWDDYNTLPADGNYAGSNFTHSFDFVANDTTYSFTDPNSILSSGTTYYRAQAV